jgi:peptidoglycan/LPS O-acetylase OafA/YrhL
MVHSFVWSCIKTGLRFAHIDYLYPAVTLVGVAVALAFATLVYRTVEVPARRLMRTTGPAPTSVLSPSDAAGG